MTDEQFLQQIEACTLPKEAFTHRNHVRLAWLYLTDRTGGDPDARIAETIQRYATSIGAATKFDQDLTMKWMRKVEAAMAATPANSFEKFMASAGESLSNSKS
jgi:hypothetical protein